MGPDFEQARREVATSFATAKVVKPKGTRDNSVEVFIVGLSKRAA
jgi:23S rRNA U2552 (ribose-2'-O)-methylase RlmE/FtsJ